MANNELLQFIGALIVLAVLTWFANISEATGNVAVAFMVLLWAVWAVKNGGNIGNVASKIGL